MHRNREDKMAQAEAFETDFWKHADVRKLWNYGITVTVH
jgi:hypothetical protein